MSCVIGHFSVMWTTPQTVLLCRHRRGREQSAQDVGCIVLRCPYRGRRSRMAVAFVVMSSSVRAGTGAHQLRRQGRASARSSAPARAVDGRGQTSHVQHHARLLCTAYARYLFSGGISPLKKINSQFPFPSGCQIVCSKSFSRPVR